MRELLKLQRKNKKIRREVLERKRKILGFEFDITDKKTHRLSINLRKAAAVITKTGKKSQRRGVIALARRLAQCERELLVAHGILTAPGADVKASNRKQRTLKRQLVGCRHELAIIKLQLSDAEANRRKLAKRLPRTEVVLGLLKTISLDTTEEALARATELRKNREIELLDQTLKEELRVMGGEEDETADGEDYYGPEDESADEPAGDGDEY